MQVLPSYGGRCARCGGRHAISASPAAIAAADALRRSLERHRRLDFDSPSSNDPSSSSFSTLPFLPRSEGGNGGPGRMLGVLLCADRDGGDGPASPTTVLRAFSGQLALSAASTGEGGGGWHCPGWSGPVAGITNESREYGRFRAISDALTRRIEGRARGDDDGDQNKRLRARRRGLSHALIARVQESYVTRDLMGRPVALREAYLGLAETEDGAEPPLLPITRLSPSCGGVQADAERTWLGFPAGTGDCCAPKLLHEAALKGLKPIAMAEFWFGAPPDGDGGDEALGASASSSSSESEEEDEQFLNLSEKEAAWRRRQRRSVLKAGRRRKDAAAATAAEPPRVHGAFYPPCAKCLGILGAMLCGCGA